MISTFEVAPSRLTLFLPLRPSVTDRRTATSTATILPRSPRIYISDLSSAALPYGQVVLYFVYRLFIRVIAFSAINFEDIISLKIHKLTFLTLRFTDTYTFLFLSGRVFVKHLTSVELNAISRHSPRPECRSSRFSGGRGWLLSGVGGPSAKEEREGSAWTSRAHLW